MTDALPALVLVMFVVFAVGLALFAVGLALMLLGIALFAVGLSPSAARPFDYARRDRAERGRGEE